MAITKKQQRQRRRNSSGHINVTGIKNREHARAYARKWRQENPEKTAEYNRQYWERQAMQQLKAVKENS